MFSAVAGGGEAKRDCRQAVRKGKTGKRNGSVPEYLVGLLLLRTKAVVVSEQGSERQRVKWGGKRQAHCSGTQTVGEVRGSAGAARWRRRGPSAGAGQPPTGAVCDIQPGSAGTERPQCPGREAQGQPRQSVVQTAASHGGDGSERLRRHGKGPHAHAHTRTHTHTECGSVRLGAAVASSRQ